MTDVKRKIRWMPVVLGISLALNLAVVAAVAGAAWRHRDGDRGGPRAARGGVIYMQALPREVRHDLYRQLRAGMPERPDTAEMLATLRQEPFDPDAAARILDAQREGGRARQEQASAAWLRHISGLSMLERNAYADRLQQLAERRKSRKRYRED